MAGNTVKDMTTNFGKLDKFEGHDFRRWQKKMHFLLTTLKVVYVLTTPMPELLEDATVEAIRIRAKWENDDYICRGHILNGMSDSLFDVYMNVVFQLRSCGIHLNPKYMAEDSSSNKFLAFFMCMKCDAIAWWIDSGATTHVCKDRCWFKTYEPVEDGSVLYMGDDHFAPVYGKGRFGYYNNGMFMLNLNKVLDDSDSVYMSLFVVNSLLWHARLGHVHYKRMLEMSKDELIPAIDENPDKYRGGEYYDLVFFQSVSIIHETIAPYTPQQNGVAERKNRALKKMVNSCYLLRDDHSDDVPSEISEPRKGKRVRKAKSYGSDFQLYLVEGSRDQVGSQYFLPVHSIEEDHRTIMKARKSRDSAFWKKRLT
ncbi:zinc finger, CCHC-type containing protein [Tanacetum coccineum]